MIDVIDNGVWGQVEINNYICPLMNIRKRAKLIAFQDRQGKTKICHG